MTYVYAVLSILVSWVAIFLIYWITNPTENGSTFRDWIRRFLKD
jgi:hypothetical protein